MSDTYEIDGEDNAPGKRKASPGQMFSYLWRHWSSQPGKLAGFGVFFFLAVACDLAFPFASARLIEALADGPTDAGKAAAAATYGVVALLALGFYFARNIGVRFWLPY